MSRLLALSVALAVAGQAPAADDWAPLFNGTDLSGWETSLGLPVGGKDPVGVGRDPKGVFSVVELDGKPAIRITGARLLPRRVRIGGELRFSFEMVSTGRKAQELSGRRRLLRAFFECSRTMV